MMRLDCSAWAALLLLLPLTVGCSSSGSGVPPQQLASEICEMQITCEYQLADQTTCADLFVQFFDQSQLEACHTCLEANQDCATQQDACGETCSL